MRINAVQPPWTLECDRPLAEELPSEDTPYTLNSTSTRANFVKRKDGEDYEPSSLRGLFPSVSRFMKGGTDPVRFFDDKDFDQGKKCVEARSKQLKKQGKAK